MNLEQLAHSLPHIASFATPNSALFNTDNFSWIPNGSVDFVLTDPPFNIARDTNFHTYEGNTINSFRFDADKGWDSHTPDDFRSLLTRWAGEFARVLRPGGSFAVFCADEYISDLINSLRSAGLKPRRTITWRKPNAVPINRKHMMMSACEYIVVGVKGSKSVFNADISGEKLNLLTEQEIVAISDKAGVIIELEIRKKLATLGFRPTPAEVQLLVKRTIDENSSSTSLRSINIYQKNETSAQLCIPNFVTFNSKSGNRLHPTEKPVPLLRYLISLFSNPGDLILDPFAGSASTGEASLQTFRKSILVEQDIDFFANGSQRLTKIESQSTLI